MTLLMWLEKKTHSMVTSFLPRNGCDCVTWTTAEFYFKFAHLHHVSTFVLQHRWKIDSLMQRWFSWWNDEALCFVCLHFGGNVNSIVLLYCCIQRWQKQNKIDTVVNALSCFPFSSPSLLPLFFFPPCPFPFCFLPQFPPFPWDPPLNPARPSERYWRCGITASIFLFEMLHLVQSAQHFSHVSIFQFVNMTMLWERLLVKLVNLSLACVWYDVAMATANTSCMSPTVNAKLERRCCINAVDVLLSLVAYCKMCRFLFCAWIIEFTLV